MPAPPAGGGSPASPAPGGTGASPPVLPPLGSSSEPSRAPSTRRAHRLLAIVVATLLVVGGSGAATAFLLVRGTGEELLQLVPASSEVVVTAYLDPSAGQKVNLMALAHRFPALCDDQQLGHEVDTALDEALADAGLTHQDVRPWLGSQAAVVVDLGPGSEATTSVLISSTDDGAAAAALEKGLGSSLGNEETREYEGVTMHVFGVEPSLTSYAIVDHVVVLSDRTTGVTSVIDASNGTTPAIADDPAFLDTTSSLPQGRLALAYVNAAEIVDRALAESGLYAAADGTPGLDTMRAIEGIGMSLSADPDGLALDVAVHLDPSKLDPTTREQLDQPAHENAMLQLVPDDSFVVATQEGIDTSLQQVVDQVLASPEGERVRQRVDMDGFLATLTGDLAFEVGPGTGAMPVGGAILIGVSDAATAQHTMDGLADLLLVSQTEVELGRALAERPLPAGAARAQSFPAPLDARLEDLDVPGHDDPIPGRPEHLEHGIPPRLRGGGRRRDHRIQSGRDPQGDRREERDAVEHHHVVHLHAGSGPGSDRRGQPLRRRGGGDLDADADAPTRRRPEPRAPRDRGRGNQHLVVADHLPALRRDRVTRAVPGIRQNASSGPSAAPVPCSVGPCHASCGPWRSAASF